MTQRDIAAYLVGGVCYAAHFFHMTYRQAEAGDESSAQFQEYLSVTHQAIAAVIVTVALWPLALWYEIQERIRRRRHNSNGGKR